MNKLRIFLILVVTLILQATIFSRFSLWGVHANLTIPVLVALSTGFGPFVGGYNALWLGLWEDILFSPVLGARALTYFVLGFLIGNSEAGINREDIRTGLLFTVGATVANTLILLLISVILKDRILSAYYLKGPLLLEILYNSLLYVLVFFIVKRIFVLPRFRV